MRYLSEDEATRMRGLGYAGELYEDLDGNLYGWVERSGDAIGAWQELSQAEVPPLERSGRLYAGPGRDLYYEVKGLAEEEAAEAKAAEPEPSGEKQAPEGTGPGRRVHPRARGRQRRPGLPSQRPGAGAGRLGRREGS